VPDANTIACAKRPLLAGFDPLALDFIADPAEVIGRAHREQPVIYYPALDFWILTKYDDIRAALRDVTTCASSCIGLVPPPHDIAPRVPDLSVDEIMVSMDPPKHTVSRAPLISTFGSTTVNALEKSTSRLANELIDRFISNGACELMQEYCYPLSLAVIVKLLGVPEEHSAKYRQWTDDFFQLLTPKGLDSNSAPVMKDIDVKTLRECWLGLADANEFFGSYVTQRENNPGTDLVSAMLLARTPDGKPAIDRGLVIRHIQSLIGAGHDTTANLIAQLAVLFIKHPDQCLAALEEPKLMPNAIDEALRLRGSAMWTYRLATRDVEVRGVMIPRNARLTVELGSRP